MVSEPLCVCHAIDAFSSDCVDGAVAGHSCPERFDILRFTCLLTADCHLSAIVEGLTGSVLHAVPDASIQKADDGYEQCGLV